MLLPSVTNERMKMDTSSARWRHSNSIGQAFLWTLILTLVLFMLAPAVGNTQVSGVTNITSSGLGTDVQPPSGGAYNITGGTRPGVNGLNLFHSFGDFSIGPGDIANFLNNTGLETSNIISRVTGGNISSIDGTIRTTDFGNANVFLVNPSGIVFGPQGSFDVGGSVSMSTADYLRFEGTSTLFDMLSSPASLGSLSVAPVVAFGFAGPELPAPLTVQGSILQVPEGQSLSLVGGDITVQAANLRAPGGQLNLVSVASPGEVLVPSFQTGSFAAMGTVTIKEIALLDVGGQFDEFGTPIGNGNSGTVLVRGGQFVVMDASAIRATSTGAVDGENTAVDIRVSQDVALSTGAQIIVGTSGSGRGGDVVIEAGNLHLSDLSEIRTEKTGPGPGGDLFLNVGTLRLLGGSTILSTTSGGDLDFDGVPDINGGAGGNVTVQGRLGMGSVADSVLLSGGSRIASEAQNLGEGGGRISITSTSLDLDEASFITSSTTADGTDLDGDGIVDITGRGGDIVVAVQGLNVVGGSSMTSSTTSFNEGAAAGGTVTVQGLKGPGSKAGSVLLSGVAGIVSESALGLPGDLTVNAGTLTITDSAVISAGSASSAGPAGNVTVKADSVVISADGQILSRSFAQNSGQVTITADRLALDNGSIVTNTSSEIGGRGGDVVVNGGIVSLMNGASINSQSGSEDVPFSTGRAGDIAMNVGTLTLTDGSSISSASIGTPVTNPDDGTIRAPGTAGNVVITATGSFTSDGSTVATSAVANRGGDVSITAHSVQLSNGTLITANSNAPLVVKETVLIDGLPVEQVVGDGNAGNITVRSGSTFVMQNSSMTTEATQASGGQITIITPEMVRVVNGQVSTSVAGSANDTAGGNITIDPQFVVLQGAQIVAKAFAGTGGAIDIIATSAFIRDPASIVDASSTLGISGTINIQSPLQNIGGELAPLSDEFSSAAALLAQQCAARAADGKFSTFVVAAREGVPVEPGGFLASPLLTSELLGSRLPVRDSYRPIAAVTGPFPEYEARPIQLAKLGNACRHQ
ncbi:MAG: filamentous hemagglutinin N-terminal domain-containing protein [Nitrospira sp.]|nr:MAG: filamentous hemagglutinin N-terminal domain-containing protein [Nitrospira sp.]